jgi:hypothetical protein
MKLVITLDKKTIVDTNSHVAMLNMDAPFIN